MEDKEIIKNFLGEKGVLHVDKDKQLAEVVKIVAEIPWGEGRSVEEVLVAKKVGTCTGKHLVLQACFDELGIRYTPVVCTFRWIDQRIRYPEELRGILNEGAWEHGHNFVQIGENGNNIDVDVTWNSKLKPYGFRAFPKNWDGDASFVGVDRMIRRWDGVNIGSMKKELVESLEPEVRERRERFLKKFIEWVDSVNR